MNFFFEWNGWKEWETKKPDWSNQRYNAQPNERKRKETKQRARHIPRFTNRHHVYLGVFASSFWKCQVWMKLKLFASNLNLNKEILFFWELLPAISRRHQHITFPFPFFPFLFSIFIHLFFWLISKFVIFCCQSSPLKNQKTPENFLIFRNFCFTFQQRYSSLKFIDFRIVLNSESLPLSFPTRSPDSCLYLNWIFRSKNRESLCSGWEFNTSPKSPEPLELTEVTAKLGFWFKGRDTWKSFFEKVLAS